MKRKLEKALLSQIPAEQAELALVRYRYWYNFLYHQVEFNIESKLHGVVHSSRVLLYAVILGYRLNLNEQELDTLCWSATFHDSYRYDDGADIGHGERASTYYRQYCQQHQLAVNEIAICLMKCHDRVDDFGIQYITKHLPNDAEAIRLYKIFKDADGLDRFRLGEQYFNPAYLRTSEAKQLVNFAQNIVANTGGVELES
ncbi:HD domain-containing protein [Mannheimia sp. AT1]|uniref:HD domain-containing protein n=1 Tax=Mannheimia cairinae TaxID=3025936 RepID=A0ABT5MPE2_9PAST|nr:HD domain-containing protein [Mannheimia cairinae]MDD0824041.1 HD domain-containing protein [Mannheimia cairinae]MDD0827157.1 HD domain-containing protein [Mannheimia cairinae]